jgi:CheY-like chemotaxis protein
MPSVVPKVNAPANECARLNEKFCAPPGQRLEHHWSRARLIVVDPPGAASERTAPSVLYIEDNAVNMILVEEIVAMRPDTELLAAATAEDGIRLARDRRPSLILLDLHLPDTPGPEVLRRLRSDPTTAGIPVVAITADARETKAQEFRAAGADRFLTKPIEVQELLEILSEVLGDAP